jgi:rSAM-associated Gly-rich repeat protein
VFLMLLREKYLKILSGMLPAGAVGVSLMLGSAAPAAADQDPARSQPPAAEPSGVSDRLAAIRDAVSSIDYPKASQAGEQVAWWAWRNGGGGWRNGGAAWGNGGWRNGGWRNGGWRNGPWSNFWRNF